jgi:Protein of unknown function DUF262/Protein of unknown function (DUF1524)
METKKPSVGELIFDIDKTFNIPPYQRGYQWKNLRWQNLVRDIADKVTGDSSKQHWIGIIITSLSEEQTPLKSYKHKYYDLIDGQQRMVTLRIWLQAILDHASDNGIALLGNAPTEFAEIICQEADKEELNLVLSKNMWRQKWRTYNADESGLLHCYTYFRWILWLGQAALAESEPDPLPKKSRSEAENALPVEQQWEKALERRMHALGEKTDTEDQLYQVHRSAPVDCSALINATINSLSLVELERQEALDEDPAEIFEALNGQRTPLEQFDHVRNFIFTGVRDHQRKKSLYEDLWKHYEVALHDADISSRGSSPAETFLYDFLISQGEKRFQKSFSKTRTAGHFSRYFLGRTSGNHEQVAREVFLPNLAAWIAVSRKGERFQVKNRTYELSVESRKCLQSMDSLSSGPVVPLLMKLVDRHYRGEISEESLSRQLFWIEAFLGRKVLRRLALSPLRSEMMNFVSKLSPNFTEDELRDSLLAITPNDSEIEEVLLPRTINKIEKYEDAAQLAHQKGLKSRQILAIFQAIEAQRAGVLRPNLLEGTSEEAYSIEHIYPQDSTNWRNELRRWGVSQALMENRLHTLGNLAVIPKRLNSSLSNLSYNDKKETINSPESRFPDLRVNSYWLRDAQSQWKPEDVDRRAEQLLRDALKYWKI